MSCRPGGAITIRDLLTHTAGISYGTDRSVSAQYEAKGLGPAAGFGWYTADKDEPICTTMERLASLPFVAQPGESWVYGYNTDILGCVVERASGHAARRVHPDAHHRAARDEGHACSSCRPPRATGSRAVYASGSGGTFVRAPDGARGQGAYVDGPREASRGGAGLLSTARDYARFLEMIRNGGALDGVRILAPRTVELMTTNQVGTLHSTTGLGLGLGFETVDRFGANGMRGCRRLRLGRRLRVVVRRRSGRAAHDGADDSADAEHHRHPDEVPDSRLPGAPGAGEMTTVIRIAAAIWMLWAGFAQAGRDGRGWTSSTSGRRTCEHAGRIPTSSSNPGTNSCWKGPTRGGLVIAVLNDTVNVDGFDTRIVEERETKGGLPVEISRNFFAISVRTRDVYYFGEDVDFYENGKRAEEEGTWRSGLDGARFGLMMPGRPRVGARYHQEVAPGVAMDRAEIVALDATVTTPAGKFTRVLKIEETTPLEPGVREFKYYADGIGLIQDGELKLVKHGIGVEPASSVGR